MPSVASFDTPTLTDTRDTVENISQTCVEVTYNDALCTGSLETIENGFPEYSNTCRHCEPTMTTVHGSILDSPPFRSTVVTNSNGLWKQESFEWSSVSTVSLNGFCHHSLSFSSSETESGEELPTRKAQPLLKPHESSSSANEDCGDPRSRPVIQTSKITGSKLRFKSLSTRSSLAKSGTRCPLDQKKHAMATYARLRAERAKLMATLKSKKKYGKFGQAGFNSLVLPGDPSEPWPVGELVWARSKRPIRLPWWPAIIIQRPRKPHWNTTRSQLLQGVYNKLVPEFRVSLLGPIKSNNQISVPQTRLRLYRGRDEFDTFMRDTVLESGNKVKALCQFVIQPSLQPAWQLARETAEAARLTKPDSSTRLSLFPWLTGTLLRESEAASGYTGSKHPVVPHARYSTSWCPRKRLCRTSPCCSSSGDSEQSDDSDIGSVSTETRYAMSSSTSTASTGRARYMKLKKNCKSNHPRTIDTNAATSETKVHGGHPTKEIASTFEFERLRFIHVTPRHIYICSVCGTAGEQVHKASSTVTETHTSSFKKTLMDSSLVDVHFPNIVPCFGGCGNYMHSKCAQTIKLPLAVRNKLVTCQSDFSTQDPTIGLGKTTTDSIPVSLLTGLSVSETTLIHRWVSVCKLCMSGLRRCFICNLTQPCSQIFASQTASHSDGSLVPPNDSRSIAGVSSISTSTYTVEPGTSRENESDGPIVAASSDAAKTDQLEQMIRCSIKTCSRWFHPSCLRKPPFSTVVRDKRAGAFSCPAHTCLACSVETPGTIPRPTPRYIRCLLCPAAYHPGEWCLPAGSKEIAPNWIICPRHSLGEYCLLADIPPTLKIPTLSPTLTTMFRPTNVSWCFICSKGGRIICCELCPASFHEECLKIAEVPDKFICEDCISGRFPRYGEIVWARLPPNLNSTKHLGSTLHVASDHMDRRPRNNYDYVSLTAGMYWWPGEVVHPRHLPVNSPGSDAMIDATAYRVCDNATQHMAVEDHAVGLFPIRLFGVTTVKQYGDHPSLPVVLWTTRARLFPYEEGDDKRDASSSSDNDSNAGEDTTASGTRRSVCLDDGEDEDPLLQLRPADDGSSKENQQPSVNGSPVTPHSSVPKSPINTLNLRPRSARRQSLCLSKANKNSKRGVGTSRSTADLAPVAKRKAAYDSAVGQAAKGWLERREKFGQLLGRTRRPDYYQPIKVNWPLGAVRVYRLTDPSEAPRCECKPGPNNQDPCGPTSSCINRELHYECLPSVCPNGEACQNQRFTKRLYPAQRPFWTGAERGWGLKALVPIRTGDFVNEYIGDLIDEDEANRRLRFAHENNVSNYYMMKLDAQRIIDAGPKGNLSRFMNHSCDPNLNTQKWTVNGDNRIGLFAVRDIAAGEELTFDYNFVALGQERLNCRCGSTNCVGFLGTATSSNGTTHSNQRNAEEDVGSMEPRTKRHTTAAESNKEHGANGTPGSKSVAFSSLSCGKGAAPIDNVLIKESRHEHICYRCCLTNPPKRATDVQPQDDHNRSSGTPNKPQLIAKRGLERELKELVADAANCSPIKESNGRTVARASDSVDNLSNSLSCHKPEDTSSTSGTSSDNKTKKSPLVHCCRPDCSKVYHLQCLDLDNVPTGRWCCPWHHCDACGRPSHVFCCLCPASFCLAHVEGSVAVLCPTMSSSRSVSTRLSSIRRNTALGKLANSIPNKMDPPTESLVARVVCMSHTDLIRQSNEQMSVKSTAATTRRPLIPVDISSNTLTLPASVQHLRTRRSDTTPKSMSPVLLGKRRFSLRSIHNRRKSRDTSISKASLRKGSRHSVIKFASVIEEKG